MQVELMKVLCEADKYKGFYEVIIRVNAISPIMVYRYNGRICIDNSIVVYSIRTLTIERKNKMVLEIIKVLKPLRLIIPLLALVK